MPPSLRHTCLLSCALWLSPGCQPDDEAFLEPADPTTLEQVAEPDAATPAPPPFARVYRIPLRVHREDSGQSAAMLAAVLDEVNHIWWTQAAVCFEIEIVRNQPARRDGFDLWFHRSRLGCGANGNGVYCGDHDLHVLDSPSLSPVNKPAWDTTRNAARTAAHELGHGLTLQHYNGQPDSNDSLMSSGRQGFKLGATEVTAARKRAAVKALPDTSPLPCAKVPLVP